MGGRPCHGHAERSVLAPMLDSGAAARTSAHSSRRTTGLSMTSSSACWMRTAPGVARRKSSWWRAGTSSSGRGTRGSCSATSTSPCAGTSPSTRWSSSGCGGGCSTGSPSSSRSSRGRRRTAPRPMRCWGGSGASSPSAMATSCARGARSWIPRAKARALRGGCGGGPRPEVEGEPKGRLPRLSALFNVRTSLSGGRRAAAPCASFGATLRATFRPTAFSPPASQLLSFFSSLYSGHPFFAAHASSGHVAPTSSVILQLGSSRPVKD